MPAESALRDGDGADFELIETMRHEPETGFLRLDRHLARLYISAAELGFTHDAAAIGEALGNALAGRREAARVRLVLRRDGAVSASAQPYEPIAADRVWRLRLARTRLSSSDTLLRHKTSRRQLYTRARAEYLVQQADEVILANERGELCEGTITTLFVDRGDGLLLTPPLECGLLAGVLRGELLDTGKAEEALLTSEQLAGARAIYVGNSLRGLIPARYEP